MYAYIIIEMRRMCVSAYLVFLRIQPWATVFSGPKPDLSCGILTAYTVRVHGQELEMDDAIDCGCECQHFDHFP